MLPQRTWTQRETTGHFMLYRKVTQVLLMAALIVVAFFLLRPASVVVKRRVVHSFNPGFLAPDNLVQPVVRSVRKLCDGTEAECFVITCRATPTHPQMGPWSPTHVGEGKEHGGIWIKDGEIYEVDGAFIAGLGDFYNDSQWNLVRDDGSIRTTETMEAFEATAKDDVDPKYHHHVVVCPAETPEDESSHWKDAHIQFVIPVRPIFRLDPLALQAHGRGREPVGFALNGVRFASPIPLQAYMTNHMIAPLDRAGGHVEPDVGYHYHAATGLTKEMNQVDGHSPLIGYALDGFAIYAHHDSQGNVADKLDECGGHYDEIRGYHYHAGAAGDNLIIRAFRGTPGTVEVLKN